MIALRRLRGCCSDSWSFFPLLLAAFLGGLPFGARAEPPPYKVELRLTEKPELQLLDNQGKIYQTLQLGTVRKRVAVQDVLLLASFGTDRQHHLIIMLGVGMTADEPTAFLFGKNMIVASPEASLALQLSPDLSNALASPGLMGRIWINGALLPSGESKKLSLRPVKTQPGGSTPDGQIIPSPDQPKPSVKDFQSIPPPSL